MNELSETRTLSPTAYEDPAEVHEVSTCFPLVERERYSLLGVHAWGGSGRILRVEDRRLRRVVALKELLRPDPSALRRFELEVQLTARLSHPAIISLFEAGRFGHAAPFYTMRLVEGTSLKAALYASTTLAQRLALVPHLITVCDALAHAHDQRIVHGDLKPSNVLLGRFGDTVLIDFGLACDLADERSPAPWRAAPTAVVMGTPAYMAPEQARGDRLDERTDVYALGAMLYHLLTGYAPYHGSSDLLTRSMRDPEPARLARTGRFPRALAQVCAYAMAKRPAERPAGAEELARLLREAHASSPSAARP